VAVAMAEHQGEDLLTDREVQVLMRVAAGSGNRMIAGELSISEETVKTHMRNIMSKLAAQDRTHAVTIAQKRGIILIT
jgi:two-component system NarL family response regulator